MTQHWYHVVENLSDLFLSINFIIMIMLLYSIEINKTSFLWNYNYCIKNYWINSRKMELYMFILSVSAALFWSLSWIRIQCNSKTTEHKEILICGISMGHQSTTYRGIQSLNWVIDRHVVLIYLYISLIMHTCI